jgi:beta-lactamase regulating signal transducer with metallopeptidase domain
MIVTSDIGKLLLSLSLSGSILAILIFATKPFIKHKLSKSIQYYVWIVVLLRLIIPFSFENSIMNGVFYSDQNLLEASSKDNLNQIRVTIENTINSSILPNVQENIVSGVNKGDANKSIDFMDIFNEYVLYIWLFGGIIALTVNLSGYTRFLKYLKQGNTPARSEEDRMLVTLLKVGKNVRLVRNGFVTTPMLVGILRPYIIIPDLDFNEKQLKNILLHEVTHLRRFDIAVKWLTMIATSIHWFNPLMYFIKKEINHACELACDEAVIKNLNSAEKQAYGDTLISVVAEHKYPIGVLQATMCEEKKSLKERLIAIMNYSKKPRIIIIFSVILLGFMIFGALFLGAGVGSGKVVPPNIYISAAAEKTKVAAMGSYSWKSGGEKIVVDTDNPIKFQYKLDNTLSVAGNEQLIIGTQKLKIDKKYEFTIDEISVYKKDQLIKFKSVEPSFINGNLYLQGPPDAGEYNYLIKLNFKDKGTVSYGFLVRVDMITYNLPEISKYKTPYVGDNIKVAHIAGNLPVADNDFKQQYTSMKTDAKPYKLTVYYERALDIKYRGVWPIVTPDSVIETNSRLNALVAFCMIDNLDEVTFAFRNSRSDGKLDESKYDTTFTFQRTSFEKIYGDLSVFRDNLDALQEILIGKTGETKASK